MSHIVDRFTDGFPVAQYYARTFGYPVKSVIFTLTIPRLNAEPLIKKALKGIGIHVIVSDFSLKLLDACPLNPLMLSIPFSKSISLKGNLRQFIGHCSSLH